MSGKRVKAARRILRSQRVVHDTTQDQLAEDLGVSGHWIRRNTKVEPRERGDKSTRVRTTPESTRDR